MYQPLDNLLEDWMKPTSPTLPSVPKADRMAREQKAKQRKDKAAALQSNRDRKVLHVPVARRK